MKKWTFGVVSKLKIILIEVFVHVHQSCALGENLEISFRASYD